jgi:predicted NBD/HSP70 family sugar kinase
LEVLLNTCFLGVEIGGTKIQVALGTQKGKLLAVEKSTVEVDHGAEGILGLDQQGHSFI